ncbi:MAG TPA: MarR family transcriptional regulator [Candidatus Caccousia avistercoris]|nr:MarR family transcriptional regulator [Candidatus Caccousia avistercoris]
MELHDLIRRFSATPEDQGKAVFQSIFLIGNRLQTLFDGHIPEITLKQFLLLALLRQAPQGLTLTQLGGLLGCSRQNVKKLAEALQKKGFASVQRNPADARAFCVALTEKARQYFRTVFPPYQEELKALFQIYTEEELAQLFRLVMKLYQGVEQLEAKTKEQS